MSGIKHRIQTVLREGTPIPYLPHIETRVFSWHAVGTTAMWNLTGSVKDIKWRDVRVGHILRVDDDELFPADLLCLYSALPDHACFIKTTNLDGESNLKIRRPVDLREAAPEEESDVMQIKASLECEPPNANLHKFQGRLVYKAGTDGEWSAKCADGLCMNAEVICVQMHVR